MIPLFQAEASLLHSGKTYRSFSSGGNEVQLSPQNEYGDCLYECREGYYACTDYCRESEPGNPDCYDYCREDRRECDQDCKDEFK